MVKIIEAKISENSEGKKYVSLKIQGEPELVQSKQGRFYATCNTCWISSTFSIEVANSLIGRELPGNVVKESSEAYEFTNESTGEVVTLHHRFVYQPEPTPVGESENETEEVEVEFSEMMA